MLKKTTVLPASIIIGAVSGSVFFKVVWLRVSKLTLCVTVHPEEIAISAATRVRRNRRQQQATHDKSVKTTVDVHASHPQPRNNVPRLSIKAKPVTRESSVGNVLKITKDSDAPFTMARPLGNTYISAQAASAPATPPPPEETYWTQQDVSVGKDAGLPKSAPDATT